MTGKKGSNGNEKGEQGMQGAQGATGDQGSTGLKGTCTHYTYIRMCTGSQAEIFGGENKISRLQCNVERFFSLGGKGIMGPDGYKGSRGSVGEAGATGAPGIKGKWFMEQISQ